MSKEPLIPPSTLIHVTEKRYDKLNRYITIWGPDMHLVYYKGQELIKDEPLSDEVQDKLAAALREYDLKVLDILEVKQEDRYD